MFVRGRGERVGGIWEGRAVMAVVWWWWHGGGKWGWFGAACLGVWSVAS